MFPDFLPTDRMLANLARLAENSFREFFSSARPTSKLIRFIDNGALVDHLPIALPGWLQDQSLSEIFKRFPEILY